MNVLDIILGIPLIWAAYKGFTKGFVIEIASLAGLILGIYLASHFSWFTADFLHDVFGWNGRYVAFVSFIITFAVVLISIHLLGKVIEKVVEMVALGFFNRIAGAVFSILKTAFVLSVILFLITSIDFGQRIITPKSKTESLLFKPVASVAPFIFPRLQLKDFSVPLPGKKEVKKQKQGTDV
jgi:membrane protein required for colicin V production